MKMLLRFLAVVVVILLLAVAGLVFFAGSALRAGVEKGGTYALGVPVSVGSGTLGIFSGEVGLGKLRISNPPNYSSNPAFAADDIRAKAEVGSLTSEEVKIPWIVIEKPEVTFEVGTGGTNFSVLLKNTEKITQGQRPGAPPSGEPSKPAGSEKRYVIGEIKVTGTKVRVGQSIVKGMESSKEVTLPDLIVRDLKSNGREGVTMAELIQRLLGEILQSVAKNGGGLPTELLGMIGKDANQALGALEQALHEKVQGALKDAVEKTQKSVDKAVDETVNAVNDIFKKK